MLMVGRCRWRRPQPENPASAAPSRFVRSIGDDDRAQAEVISAEAPVADSGYTGRTLQVPLVTGGTVQPGFTGADGVRRAAHTHRESVEQLPAEARRLSSGEPVIPTVFA